MVKYLQFKVAIWNQLTHHFFRTIEKSVSNRNQLFSTLSKNQLGGSVS